MREILGYKKPSYSKTIIQCNFGITKYQFRNRTGGVYRETGISGQ
jgi:hypothetical protein